MQAKKVATAGILAAAAGAGAYFLFSKRMAPTRKALGQKLRKGGQSIADAVEAVKQKAA